MEIEVGEYVRIEAGKFYKILSAVKNTFLCIEIRGNATKIEVLSDLEPVVKHSKNIIDLIEVDDIGIMNCYGLKVKKFITNDDILELKCRNYELLSIITKEQIKQIEYRIEE